MSDTPRILGGRYEVGELVGRGGMAEVHAGHDTRLGRPVAIKILRADLARDPSFLQRFRREAKASAGLNHTNIVAVYDSGEDTFIEATGGTIDIPYIVMEYVDGQTLREILNEEQRLSSDEACRILLGVLSALEYSHSKGIVHRDIKPGNIMLTRGGSVKVMDFGIARALADVGATMTSAQAVVGTARYLSPEQAQGQSVDPRSDLYSAGCVLFELLTGRAPFVGEPVSLVYQHIGEQPQPPSLYEHSVTPELDAVVLHSLEKKRDERYQSADEFRADVLAARSGQPISAAAQSSTLSSSDNTEIVNYSRRLQDEAESDHTAELDESRSRPGRHRGLWVLAGVTALALILGIGVLFYSQPTKNQQVSVTSVEGMTYDAANKTLSQNFTVQKQESPSDKDEGIVIGQDPPGGTKADLGSKVTLTVSTGPNAVKVPDVTGDSVEDAKTTLVAAGIDAKRIQVSGKTKDDTGVDAGKVAVTDPAANSSLSQGSTITLYPSSGKSTVPSLLGKTQSEATQELYKAHLSIDVSYLPTSDPTQVNKVISVPTQGQKTDNGSAVAVVIGTKPAEMPTVTTTARPHPVPPRSSRPVPTSPSSSSSSSSTSSSQPPEDDPTMSLPASPQD